MLTVEQATGGWALRHAHGEITVLTLDSQARGADHSRLARAGRHHEHPCAATEVVGQEQSVPMAASDAPSTIAMNKVGSVFQSSTRTPW